MCLLFMLPFMLITNFHFISVLIFVILQFCLKTMSHLPPKIPNMPPINWPHFPDHLKVSPLPSWADDFHGFSLARRSLHRRSVSDSIAFLETPMGIGSSLGSDAPSNYVFDGFDGEQVRSIGSDEIHTNEDDQPASLDHDRNEKDAVGNAVRTRRLRNEPKEEVRKEFNNVATNVSSDRMTDSKRVKRILANRQSAQRSRVRKLQYITELERSITTLQAEVSMLSPRVAFLDQQRLLLNVNNNALKQRIASLSQDNIFKDADQEALKREIERLGGLYHQQQQKNHKMDCNVPSPVVTKEQSTSPGDQKQKLLYV